MYSVVPCAVQNPDQSMLLPDKSGGRLSCVGGQETLASVMLYSKHYDFLECTSGKWKHDQEIVGSAYTPLAAECGQDCLVADNGIVVRKEKKGDKDTIVVSCSGLAILLLNSKRYSTLECNFGNWRHENEELASAFTPLPAVCEPR
ncbi:hypothetical protein PMAYCL1PPCAC_01295, partial [Pristionchus mayeri]